MIGLVLLLGGCPKPPEPPPPELVVAPPVVELPRAGVVTDGTYVDGAHGVSLRIPEGAGATVGAEGGPLRLTILHPAARVELWAMEGAGLPPRPREDCDWTFEDSARYRALKVTEPVRLATCTPREPDGPRVLAWLIERGGVCYQLAAVIPQGGLAQGRAAADAIAGTMRFRQPD